MAEQVQAEYNKRVKEVLEKLSMGRSREDISEDYKYSTWKSLDIYMRRKGFRWNSNDKMYDPEITRLDSIKEDLLSSIPLKAERIMDKFDDGLDSRTIANEMGFNDHRELAEYMKNNNLKWDSELGNYIEVLSFNDDIDDSIENIREDLIADVMENKLIDTENIEIDTTIDIQKYLPLLELLYDSKDKLSEILLDKNTSIIPSYAVPGVSKNKSIYMSDLLGRLLEDFSQTKNVSQKEIVQVALVEYFKKYGYKEEVRLLLDKR